MQFLKLVTLFTKNNLLQLRRKWITLPLLLLFPFLLLSIIASFIVIYFNNLENEPLQIGLVDLDQSKETKMIVQLLEDSSQLGEHIQINQLTKEDAERKIIDDELVSYILFPEEFAQKLYDGDSVIVTIVGNPARQTESFLIKELVESAARHIGVSQANILTINRYLHEMGIDSKERNQIVLEQFNEFLIYAIGRDSALKQNELTNNVTTSPKEYFGLAVFFFVLTIWIVSIYHLFIREQTKQIRIRMSLYGVTELQQIMARIVISFILTTLLGGILLVILQQFLDITSVKENFTSLIAIIGIYILLILFVITIIETLIPSNKLRLFIQVITIGIILLASGSLIPAIYLPLYIQEFLPFVFTYQAFYWLEEILLNGRTYVDFIPLLLSLGTGAFTLVGISLLKERVKS
ncbi:ABC transporter permease [Ornithinibacillus halotolerans]|uniref:ABC-2 type transporter transmembrane domain-containing protein n=1 Tax=Ornithinibacillus halotolerans TaxID=1274357 RepID=A0A916S650_9BACI|nr:ABC transporter permease [Ornithinibacillus halotolerans]GGA86388.1 hypothetical protein GCM10008025_31630 [Ornithinibacillus halotolerans]